MMRVLDLLGTLLLVVAMFFWIDFGQGPGLTWWALLAIK